MKRKLQFIFLLVSVFLSKHKKYIALGSVLGFILAILLLQSYPLLARLSGPRTKRVAIIGKFTEANLPIQIQSQISVGLTAVDSSGEVKNSLIQKWESDDSGKTYTFYLKANIYWHDGKKFSARDINYKIKDAVSETSNNDIYKITLKEPFSPLPAVVSKPLLKPNLVGLGIYRLAKIRYLGEYISELTLRSQIPDLPNLTYKFYPSLDDAILAFKMGEVDILSEIADPMDLSTWKSVKVTPINLYDRYVGIFFNLKDPLFKEKEIRQALTYAIPGNDNFTKAYTPISPLSWAYSQKVRLYRYDPDTAAKILTKAPISSPSSEVTITTFASFVKLAQSIVDAWAKVGVNAKVKVVNSLPADYQILLLAQAIPPDPDQYQLWQSTQTQTNLSHYSNLKIDKLLEDGRKTSDRDKRIKIYADFQRYLVDDAPVIFLYYPKVYSVERK